MQVVHEDGRSKNGLVGLTWGTRPVQSEIIKANGPRNKKKRQRRMEQNIQQAQVLVVTAVDYVSIYEEEVCLKTWRTMADGGKLGKPAVMIPGTSTLVAVTKDNQLLSWDYFDSSLQLPSDNLVKLDVPVMKLLVHPELLNALVIVLEDGSLILRDANANMLNSKSGSEGGEKVLSGDIVTGSISQEKTYLVLTEVVQLDDDGQMLQVRVGSLSNERLSPMITHRICPVEDKNPIVGTVVHSRNLMTLLWGNGTCQVVDLHRSENDLVYSEQPLMMFSEEKAMKWNQVCTASIQPVAPILFLGYKDKLIAWDARLGVELERASEKEETVSGSIRSLSINQDGSKIGLVLQDGNVLVQDCSDVNMSNCQSNLAAALANSLKNKCDEQNNKKRKTDVEVENQVSCPNLSDLLTSPDSFDAEQWKKELESKEKELRALMDKFSNQKTKKKGKSSGASLEEVFGDLQGLSINSANILASILLDMKDWENLEALITKTEAISCSMCPHLIPSVLRNGDLNLLRVCMTKLVDIGESAKIDILKYTFRKFSKNALEQFATDLEKTEEHNTALKMIEWLTKNRKLTLEERGMTYLVAHVMILQRNDDFLIQAIRSSPKNMLVGLLCSVTNMLSFFDNLPITNVDSTDVTHLGIFPSFSRCLSWVSLLLDSNLDEWVSSTSKTPEIEALLKTLTNICQKQAKLCQVMERVSQPLFYCLFPKSFPINHNRVGDYAVETIRF